MNHILKIPTFQRKKAIPKKIENLELLPFNEQFSKLTMPIISDDDLRPTMTGNFFDIENKKIVSTDAHKLTSINMPKETFEFIKQTYKKELDENPRGLIFHTLKQMQKQYNDLIKIGANNNTGLQPFDEFIKYRAIEDGRYPTYDAIIPRDFLNVINVDYQKLYWYAKVLSEAKVIDDIDKINNSNKNEYEYKKIEYLKDSYISFINPITNQIILTYILDDGTIQYIGFNAKLLCDILKFAMEYNGKTFGKIGLNGKSKALVIEFENGLDATNESIGLIMPIFLFDEYTIGQVDYQTNVKMYYDLNTNQIISDGVNYPIDQSIGFIPIKTNQNNFQAVTFTKIEKEKDITPVEIDIKTLTIDERIKGLKIVLKLARGDKKTLIERRIKGLEIAQKTKKKFSGGGGVGNITEKELLNWAKGIDDENLLSWCGYSNKGDFEDSADLPYSKKNLVETNFEDLEYVYNNQNEYGIKYKYDNGGITYSNLDLNTNRNIISKAIEFITGTGVDAESITLEGKEIRFKYRTSKIFTTISQKLISDIISTNRKSLELRGKNFSKGGGVGKGYMVFNYTDNLYATNDVFATKKEANDFIKQFKKRYEQQGYYRDSYMNKIDIEDIDLLVIEENFKPYRFSEGGSVDNYIKEQTNKFIAEKKNWIEQYRAYVKDIDYQGFLAIDDTLYNERLSDYEFDGERFNIDNLLEVAKKYPQAKYITFHARLMGDSDFGIEDELSPIVDLAMKFNTDRLNQTGEMKRYDNGGGVGKKKLSENESNKIADNFGFNLDEFDSNQVIFSTRKNGYISSEKFGDKDLADAQKLSKYIIENFDVEKTKIESVDEFVLVIVEQKEKFNPKDLQESFKPFAKYTMTSIIQNVIRETASKNILYNKISQPYVNAIEPSDYWASSGTTFQTYDVFWKSYDGFNFKTEQNKITNLKKPFNEYMDKLKFDLLNAIQKELPNGFEKVDIDIQYTLRESQNKYIIGVDMKIYTKFYAFGYIEEDNPDWTQADKNYRAKVMGTYLYSNGGSVAETMNFFRVDDTSDKNHNRVGYVFDETKTIIDKQGNEYEKLNFENQKVAKKYNVKDLIYLEQKDTFTLKDRFGDNDTEYVILVDYDSKLVSKPFGFYYYLFNLTKKFVATEGSLDWINSNLPKRFKINSSYENGGMVDLFEEQNNLPIEAQNIISKYENADSYDQLSSMLIDMEKIGYTFDYGLDAEPFALRPIGVELNQIEGYED